MLVMQSNRSVTRDDLREAILFTAYEMIRFNTRERKIRDKCCEGILTSDLEITNFEGIQGIMFRAEFDTEEGSYDINFLFNKTAFQHSDRHAEYVSRSEEEEHLRPNPIYAYFRCN